MWEPCGTPLNAKKSYVDTLFFALSFLFHVFSIVQTPSVNFLIIRDVSERTLRNNSGS